MIFYYLVTDVYNTDGITPFTGTTYNLYTTREINRSPENILTADTKIYIG